LFCAEILPGIHVKATIKIAVVMVALKSRIMLKY